MRYVLKIIASGHLVIILSIGCIAYIWDKKSDNCQIDEFRKDINNIHIQPIEFFYWMKRYGNGMIKI